MKRLGGWLAAVAILVGACGRAPQATEPERLTVFAAASLTDAFERLAAGFEADHPGADLVLNLGASQALRIQIEEGAQADVFASASPSEVEDLAGAGLILGDEVVVFARNRLTVVLPADNPADLVSLADLGRPGLRIVVADAAVPAGRYARLALESMSADPAWGADFVASVLANIVSEEETVRVVLAKVQLGEADAGFVYRSDARRAPALRTIDLPAGHNPVAEYPIGVLRSSAHVQLAQAFVEFVLSPAGQAILESHGFLPAAD